VEIKTEADSDDMTESQRDEQPSTSMFFFDFTVQAFCCRVFLLLFFMNICHYLDRKFNYF